ncbi:DNA polymerase III subunit chi [Gilvimarinus agarilyticus]|uniref:DNA polymerase III subunit chi n=1 Tax=Gilvimarinus agarilyticus TaxID=679259 RepID=UPI0005A08031|nr:DNA polymerase III subunit chi [Gilvimarinus agarilyticus]
MTEVDFYILSSDDHDKRLAFASRLCEKAINSGRKVVIAAEDDAQQVSIAQRLNSERPESYLPWRLSDAIDNGEPIVLDCQGECGNHHDVLINLCPQLPGYFSRFTRMAEVVIQTEAVLSHTRQHWSFLGERGYLIRHHKLGRAHNL